jgi:signal transduction histidine kinase
MTNAFQTLKHDWLIISMRAMGLFWAYLALSVQLFGSTALAADEAVDMDKPVAYCLSKLEDCTPERQVRFADKVPSDLQKLNAGRQVPVTLVYELPAVNLDNQQGFALMVAPHNRNHCFLFDYDSKKIICSQYELTTISIPHNAKTVLTQQEDFLTKRNSKPIFLFGTTESLQKVIQGERDQAMIFIGWFIFLFLISTAQASTRRNQVASLALAALSLTMIARIISIAPYSFSGLHFESANLNRMVEIVSVCGFIIFITEFYGQLIQRKWLKIRRVLQFFCLIVSVSSVFFQSSADYYYIQRATYLCVGLAVVMIVFQIKVASELLSYRERLVLFLGVGIFLTGAALDLFLAFLFKIISNFVKFAFAFETLCQFLLLALRNDNAHLEAQRLQKEQLETQAKLVQTLEQSEQELNAKVKERTAELETANSQILSAYNTADALRIKAEAAKEEAEIAKNLAETQRQQAEAARQETAQALADLKATQNQLIAAEKMASLGLLVSNVAHEINTPIGAVKSSGALIADTLESTLAEMPKLFSLLEAAPRGLFIQLVLGNKGATPPISTREERALTKQIAAQLEESGVDDINRKARLLMKLRAHQNPLEYLPLLQHPESDFILEVASNIADVVNSTHNINHAVERVSRVVYALKALSGDDVLRAVTHAPLQPDMDKALAKYASQMQNVELIQHYQADMPAIRADHDAVEQLCIHLVMNALQAMNYSGQLTVGLHADNNRAIISVTDTGSGIADDIKDRIFEPFFTTRTSGEGSGMGLAIVKRIVEQHQGKIDVETAVGAGTTFTVTLPYA